MTDPVQEARGIALEHILAATEVEDVRDALTAYAAAIRREEADRVLPVLRSIEWGGEIDFCPGCSAVQWSDQHESWCLLATEITRLEALVKEGEDD